MFPSNEMVNCSGSNVAPWKFTRLTINCLCSIHERGILRDRVCYALNCTVIVSYCYITRTAECSSYGVIKQVKISCFVYSCYVFHTKKCLIDTGVRAREAGGLQPPELYYFSGKY